MRIFMIRHEAAENRQMGYSDKDRALTSKGIQAMKEQVKTLKSKVKPSKQVAIWTSSAKRALQTAEIVAEALDVDTSELVQKDYLYEQDGQR